MMRLAQGLRDDSQMTGGNRPRNEAEERKGARGLSRVQPVRRWPRAPAPWAHRRWPAAPRTSQAPSPGEIAIIDHEDIARVAADALVACVPDVHQRQPSMSGRIQNRPELYSRGDPITRRPNIMTAGPEGHGDPSRGRGGYSSGGRQGQGSAAEWRDKRDMVDARARCPTRSAFATTPWLLGAERDLIIDGEGVPDVRTDMGATCDDRRAWAPLQEDLSSCGPT